MQLIELHYGTNLQQKLQFSQTTLASALIKPLI